MIARYRVFYISTVACLCPEFNLHSKRKEQMQFPECLPFWYKLGKVSEKKGICLIILQTQASCRTTLQTPRNDRFHVVLIWNADGAFVGKVNLSILMKIIVMKNQLCLKFS